MIGLSEIVTDETLQPRGVFNVDVISEYADAMKDGVEFPPVVVYFDGETNWLADGFHRYRARRKADFPDIKAEVRPGGKDEAILFSVGANSDHGVRRTNDDKRRAVLRVIGNARWCMLDDPAVASYCHVSSSFVARIREQHADQLPAAPAVRIDSNGTLRRPISSRDHPTVTSSVRPVILSPSVPINAPNLSKSYGDPIFKRLKLADASARRDVETPFGKIDIATESALYWFCAVNEPFDFWRIFGRCDFMRRSHSPTSRIVLVGFFSRSVGHIIDFARREGVVEFLSPDALLKGDK